MLLVLICVVAAGIAQAEDLATDTTTFVFLPCPQAEKAEKEARDLKGTMRKRMEFLDFD